ncbi:FAD-dependent oxidoreductase [Longimicrobium sp.]|uniref:FAD-dependent oxidoreductase n=1 Tax=Longimicrobium sp. TaxID=2029185 RepID=UPI002E33C14A|nr:FAD-dependent oxidoreductase [Longimicrobium sp.]HEX6038621.1 FAD-dependent oxidoreductase [Longimicrobium sp.]
MAARPVLLTVDDDPEVLRAVERDLKRRYVRDYRVLSAASGPAALDLLRQLSVRGDPVALLLADQRMPGMSGVEFLEASTQLAPTAKRAILTAYADIEAAIGAINRAGVDYYFQKPWDPPEENLYPVVDDLLDDWRAGWRPGFEGIRIIGPRWSPQVHDIKDFLARNQVPYRALDIESDKDARELLSAAGASPHQLPVVLFPDGAVLVQPGTREVAEKAGLKTQADKPFYDLAIIGAGPAGLAAAVYGASEGLKTVVLDAEAPGGQAGTSALIENYLGFPRGLSGADLTRRAVAQARKFGAELLTPVQATGLRLDGPYRYLSTSDGGELSCHAVMVTCGVQYRKLAAEGVEALTGAGIYYGSTMTEALSCTGRDVYIVGAGNSAGQAAVYLATVARSVNIVLRGDDLGKTMSQYLVDQIERTENIHVHHHTQVHAAHGDGRLEELTLMTGGGATRRVEAAALFIFIGAMPNTDWLGDCVMRDNHGFILTGPDVMRDGRPPREWPLERDPFLLEASVPGVFCAGDVRHGSVKRVASGVGEGSVAISFVHQYLADL